MSIWDDTLYSIGDKVIVLDLSGATGTVINIRFDDRGEPLITVNLDDTTIFQASPDGIFIARDFELRKVED